jgi:hypothetical protein
VIGTVPPGRVTRLASVLVLLLLALPLGACNNGDECDTCTSDDDCKNGLVCSTFSDDSRRCGYGTGETSCRVR